MDNPEYNDLPLGTRVRAVRAQFTYTGTISWIGPQRYATPAQRRTDSPTYSVGVKVDGRGEMFFNRTHVTPVAP
ncbi:hypothetical protein ACF06O_30720, partial [Streptomyces albidoflavus]